MRRIVRPAVLLAAASLVIVAAGAGATSSTKSLSFKDPVGDTPTGTADIVSVKLSTTGTGVGKKYVPKVLVLTMTLAATATKDGTTEYSVGGMLSDCGRFYMNYVPGTRLGGTFAYADCGSAPDETGSTGTSFDVAPTADGKTVTFRATLKAIPGKVSPGAELSQLWATTDLVEPATGIFGVGILGTPFYDEAKTTAEYVVR